MSEWLTIDSLTRLESGGKAMTASIADSANIHIEASPDHRDLRISDGNYVAKI